MPGRSLLALTLRQGRRGLVGWLVGMLAVVAVYSASYPSVGKAKADIIASYPESLKKALNLQDFSSPAGYLGSTVFGILLVLLVSIFAITSSTRAVAADEESGVLDLLLSYPLSRTTVVLARMAALALVVAGMGVVVLAALIAVRGPAGLTISAANLAATTAMWVLLGWCVGAVSMAVSAATGQRSLSLAVSTAIAVVAYLAATFLPLVPGLGWVRSLSPYDWFSGGQPLAHGLQLGDCGLLLATTAAAVAVAAVALRRRDIHA